MYSPLRAISQGHLLPLVYCQVLPELCLQCSRSMVEVSVLHSSMQLW